MLEIHLLGHYDVRRDGAPVQIPSRQAQSLLAYLVLTAGTAHRREKLAGLLWPDATEANARAYLRQALWRLRKALHASADDYFTSDELSIGFDPGSSFWLDTLALDGRPTQTEPNSIGELMLSLDVYRGELLPGFYDDWAMIERDRLQAVFERKARLLLDGLTEARRWPELLDWAERWIALGGAPEPAYRALMRAQAGLGDISGVRAAFQRCEAALSKDLGVPPSAETRALLQALTTASAEPARPRPTGAASGLPPQPTPFVGRERELEQTAGLLRNPDCRLLSLIGPGGIGKTRLALQAARQAAEAGLFADGVAFVPLAPVGSADMIAPAVASAIGLALYGALDPTTQLLNHLRGARGTMLLVLDNFEHLLAEAAQPGNGAALLADMLAADPQLKLLVSTVERLNLRGEWLLEVEGLPYPDANEGEVGGFSAVQLFVQSARRAAPRFTLSSADQAAAAQICRLVGGAPLAIELAAAWVRSVSLPEIAVEIERNLDFLAGATRDRPQRHHSMRAVFDHAWKLLAEREQDIFRSLSIFRGGFTREAAGQVAGASLADLSALVDKSLLRRSLTGRYELLELLRQYAGERLAESGQAETVALRHRDWCRQLVRANRMRGLWGNAEAERVRRLEIEYANLSAALSWSMAHGEPPERLELVGGLTWFWYVTAQFKEGSHWVQQALAGDAGAPAFGRAYAVMSLGVMLENMGEYDRASRLHEEAVALFRALGDETEVGWALHHLGNIALFRDDFEQAMAAYSESLATFQALRFEGGISSLLVYMGIAAGYQGDDEQAESLLSQGLERLKPVDDRVGITRALLGLGRVALHRGQRDRAQVLFEESLTTAHERGYRLEIAESLEGLAEVAHVADQPGRAIRLFASAATLRQAMGTPLPPRRRAEHERNLALLRAGLTGETFEAAWSAGRTMALSQAVTYALTGS